MVKCYDLGGINEERLGFAVICAEYKGKWIFVRHKERITWEIPGGHREENEDINAAAARKLNEETGAVSYEIKPICDYSVIAGDLTSYRRLFYANVAFTGKYCRRKGYGREVTAAMIEKLLELGQVPFVHIEEDNVKSMNLAVKIDFREDRLYTGLRF